MVRFNKYFLSYECLKKLLEKVSKLHCRPIFESTELENESRYFMEFFSFLGLDEMLLHRDYLSLPIFAK